MMISGYGNGVKRPTWYPWPHVYSLQALKRWRGDNFLKNRLFYIQYAVNSIATNHGV